MVSKVEVLVTFAAHDRGEVDGSGSYDRVYALGLEDTSFLLTFCWKIPIIRPHLTSEEAGEFSKAGSCMPSYNSDAEEEGEDGIW